MKNILKISALFVFLFIAGKPTLNAQTTITSSLSDSTVTIKTNGQCGECKERLESNLSVMKGVKSATFDLNTKDVTIVFNPAKTSSAKLRTAISKIGYDADNVKADPKAQSKLPKCCQPPTN
ncbi:MAG TPA: heavy-metal-associated domain-containing protein [Bacteroidia bacterium]|nr:heavy-metal-associated domain-containing protein [Bacteroidia bacterium]